MFYIDQMKIVYFCDWSDVQLIHFDEKNSHFTYWREVRFISVFLVKVEGIQALGLHCLTSLICYSLHNLASKWLTKSSPGWIVEKVHFWQAVGTECIRHLIHFYFVFFFRLVRKQWISCLSSKGENVVLGVGLGVIFNFNIKNKKKNTNIYFSSPRLQKATAGYNI